MSSRSFVFDSRPRGDSLEAEILHGGVVFLLADIGGDRGPAPVTGSLPVNHINKID